VTIERDEKQIVPQNRRRSLRHAEWSHGMTRDSSSKIFPLSASKHAVPVDPKLNV
jgi:hypothetical protein